MPPVTWASQAPSAQSAESHCAVIVSVFVVVDVLSKTSQPVVVLVELSGQIMLVTTPATGVQVTAT